MKSKHMIAAATVLVISLFGTATPQEVNHRLFHANGQGTLKVGQEQFKVNGIVVKLLDDQKAELTLISDITFFLSGTWSRNTDSQDAFNLQITGGATPGGLEGSGKLTLGKDKDLRLNLKGKSRTSGKDIEVYFVGK